MTNRLNPTSLRTLPVVGTRRVRPHWGLGEGSGFPMRLLQLIPDLPGAEGELLCQALDICFPVLNQRGPSSELKGLMAVETEPGSGPDIHCPLPAGPAVQAPYRLRVLLVAHVLVSMSQAVSSPHQLQFLVQVCCSWTKKGASG